MLAHVVARNALMRTALMLAAQNYEPGDVPWTQLDLDAAQLAEATKAKDAAVAAMDGKLNRVRPVVVHISDGDTAKGGEKIG
jgi:hypothetical protein